MQTKYKKISQEIHNKLNRGDYTGTPRTVYEFYKAYKNELTWPQAFCVFFDIEDHKLYSATDSRHYSKRICEHLERITSAYPKPDREITDDEL